MDFNHQILRHHTFGIVDASAIDDLPAEIMLEQMVPESLRASEHLMPALINLRDLSVSVLSDLLKNLYDAHTEKILPPVGLLVRTEAKPSDFIRHWNSIQYPSIRSQPRVWLRIHDPRVMHHLLRILTDSQRRALFGAAKSFTYWLGNKWITVHREAERDEECISPKKISVSASPHTWDWPRIERIGLLNRALSKAGFYDFEDIDHKSALAEQLIDRAHNRYGLINQADLVEFAARALAIPNFEEHPTVVKAIMDSLSNTDSTLADRLDLIDESVWQELSQANLNKYHHV